MPRIQKKRKFNDDKLTLVIVCEGKETERPYFEEIVKQSPLLSKDDVTIYPIPSEEQTKSFNGKGKRHFLKPNNNEYYPGVSDPQYEKYNYEPMRWVRATELIMVQKKCTEGWAVYDLDNKSGRTVERHREAYKYSKNLHIAFSAYCFEEWFLLHYERNGKGFSDSECKDSNKKQIKCGSKSCVHPDDCKGEKCLGGYLRKQGYFAMNGNEYNKASGAKYAEISATRLHQACVNAAWLRSLEPEKPPYERNPYSDVDMLIMKLLNETWEQKWNINWISLGDTFSLGGERYKIVRSNDTVSITHESSNSSAVISKDNIYWCSGETTTDYRALESACSTNNVNFSRGNEVILMNKPKGKAILCIRNGYQEFYIEIK